MRSGEKRPLSFREPSVMGTDGSVHLVLHCLEQRMWHTRLTLQHLHMRERQSKFSGTQMLEHGAKRVMASEHHLGMNEKSLQRPRAKTVLFQPLFFNSQFLPLLFYKQRNSFFRGVSCIHLISGFQQCNPKMMGCQEQKRTVIPETFCSKNSLGRIYSQKQVFLSHKKFWL